jgi:peptidoglycan hydrolase-like protein with peptidoglycan-binding domain
MTTSQTSQTSSTPALKWGNRGPEVATLQRLLNAAAGSSPQAPGHANPPLSVDGDFGDKTLQAVKAFQRASGLEADGKVGSLTWNALRIAAPSASDVPPAGRVADAPSDRPGALQGCPPRPPDAMTGSQFQAEVETEKYSEPKRDQRVLYEILSGNFPDFYRQLAGVTVSEAIGGVTHRVTYRVMPDYLAIGSDDDYLRMPMSPLTAQIFGDAFGFMLPTPKMVDQIHDAAPVKLQPKPISPNSESFDLFVQNNDVIQAQLQQANAQPGALVDGDKKDVVTSVKISGHPKKVVIYGWHYPTSGVIQPLFPSGADPNIGHDIWYMDYSHGLRMVEKTVTVDGQEMNLVDLLADPVLCKLVSNEGPVTQPRYQGAAPTPLPPPGKAAPDPLPPPDEPMPDEPMPDEPLSVADYERSAWHSMRIQIDRGVKQYGQGKSWEVPAGTNRGPLVEEYLTSVGLWAGNPWCGAFVGYNYLEAGFDGSGQIPSNWTPDNHPEPRKIIFQSASRLHLYFQKSGCPCVEFPLKGLTTRDACKKWLDEHLAPFAPQPGDIVLCHTSGDYKHVAMVASYDPDTYALVTYEGNHDDRAGAFLWDLSDPRTLGFYRVNLIGRFTSTELTHSPQVPPSGPSPDPVIEQGSSARTT